MAFFRLEHELLERVAGHLVTIARASFLAASVAAGLDPRYLPRTTILMDASCIPTNKHGSRFAFALCRRLPAFAVVCCIQRARKGRRPDGTRRGVRTRSAAGFFPEGVPAVALEAEFAGERPGGGDVIPCGG